jgi:hypothetical protein
MSPLVDLEQVEQDARQSFTRDGLIYLFLGSLLALLGLSFFNERLSWMGAMAVFLLLPIEAIRKRITYPRIGYAKFTAPKGEVRGIARFAIIAIVVLVLIALVSGGRYQRYLPAGFGIVLGLAFYFGFSMSGLTLRDGILVVLILGSGFVTGALFDEWRVATAVQFWVIAAITIPLGAYDLIRFMKENPVVGEAMSKKQD